MGDRGGLLDVFPGLSMNYLAYGMSIDFVSFGYFLDKPAVCVPPSDFCHLTFVEFGSVVFFSFQSSIWWCVSPTPNAVFHVTGMSSPFKVREIIISWVVVFMARFHSIWAGTDKGKQNQPVDECMADLTVFPEINPLIFQRPVGGENLHQFARKSSGHSLSFESECACEGDLFGDSLHTSSITDPVQSDVAWYTTPIFQAVVGVPLDPFVQRTTIGVSSRHANPLLGSLVEIRGEKAAREYCCSGGLPYFPLAL